MIPGDRELIEAIETARHDKDLPSLDRMLFANVGRLVRIAQDGLRAQDQLRKITAVITGEDRRDS